MNPDQTASPIRTPLWQWACLGIIIAIGVYFSFHRLTQSPPTWYDEGMILQLAENLALHGSMVVQMGPNDFISGWHISTGFPVIAPVALSFKLFGIGLLQARSIAVMYILLLITGGYFVLRKLFSSPSALWGIALVTTFSSLYGNGKNVLGEVPGLFFIVLFLFALYKLEKSNFSSRKSAILTGLFFGLACATKPIFILLVPALFVALLVKRKHIAWRTDSRMPWVITFVVAGIIPALIYICTQFGPQDSIQSVLHFFANPYDAGNVQSMIWPNFVRFFTEGTPIYTALTFLIWLGALILKKVRKLDISISEYCAFFFATIVLIAYLRLPGWYRYLFPANIVILLFLPQAIKTLGQRWMGSSRASPTYYLKYVPQFILAAFLIFQSYYLVFGSWISTSQGDDTVAKFTAFTAAQPATTTYFIYDTPEVVPLLGSSHYYQYFYAGGVWVAGTKNLAILAEGKPDIVIVDNSRIDVASSSLHSYKASKKIGRYFVFRK